MSFMRVFILSLVSVAGAENELYYPELHAENSGAISAIRDFETNNSMNFYPTQPICCPHWMPWDCDLSAVEIGI